MVNTETPRASDDVIATTRLTQPADAPKSSRTSTSPILSHRRAFARFSSFIYWTTFVILLGFTFGYVLLLQTIIFKGNVFPSAGSNIGWAIHAPTGIVYFFLGLLQFHPTVRRRWPRLHRACGYAYLVLSGLTTVGILMILAYGSHAAESAVLASFTGGALWIGSLVASTRAILRGDVESHRRYQIRAFAFSFSIVMMRPAVGVLMAINPRLDIGTALKTGIWWCFSWAIAGSEIYLAVEDKLAGPTMSIVNAADGLPARGQLATDLVLPSPWAPATIHEAEYLNARTVRVVFKCDPTAPFVVPGYVAAGQHVGLRYSAVDGKGIVRAYTVTTQDSTRAADGYVELVIRLAAGGAMSSRLAAAIEELNDAAVVSSPWSLAFAQSPVPFFPGVTTPLILVGAGTGLTPLLNLARLAMVTDRVHLVHFERTIGDVFLRDRLESLAKASGGKFTFEIVLTKGDAGSEAAVVDLGAKGVLAGFKRGLLKAVKAAVHKAIKDEVKELINDLLSDDTAETYSEVAVANALGNATIIDALSGLNGVLTCNYQQPATWLIFDQGQLTPSSVSPACGDPFILYYADDTDYAMAVFNPAPLAKYADNAILRDECVYDPLWLWYEVAIVQSRECKERSQPTSSSAAVDCRHALGIPAGPAAVAALSILVSAIVLL
ncbi:hypothetical protein H9P43_005086 [Blastocladiella emersonii ATCC 22665]|nr:hypothetical protein H9P43_005086 [Blastocladiella emersonii ATCC 22665]